jgi:ArsR family transcriptional regulator
MVKSKSNRRLERLTRSGFCSVENASKYADELRKSAGKTMSAESADKKSRLFKALADETRLRILSLLNMREMCVCEIMVALDLTQPTASHHLGILENAGLIKDRKEGKWVFYSISDPTLTKSMLQLNVP